MIKNRSWMAAMAVFCLVSVTGITAEAADHTATKEMVIVFEKGKSPEQIGKVKAMGVVEKKSPKGDMVVMKLTEAEIKALQADPNVRTVEENHTFTIQSQSKGYGLDKVKGERFHQYGNTGKGVKVAVIDSGIAPHEDLVVSGGESFMAYTESFSDDNGHGTHVAGIIGARDNDKGVLGIAPEAELYSLKVLNATGEGDLLGVVGAIDWSIENRMDILNMSIGIPVHSIVLEEAINRAYAEGILIVGAAGNDYSQGVLYPAKFDSVVAVSATDQMNNRASFSNIGEEIEVSAPGVLIRSTVLNNGYQEYNGTSMAAPFVAGQLALLKQAYPGETAVQLRERLQSSVIDLGAAGRDIEFGYGLIQTSFPSAVVTLTEKTGLYNEINGTNPLMILNPQTVTALEYGTDGWMKINYEGTEYWAKDGYRTKRVYVSQASGLYETQNGKVKVGSFSPQFVLVREFTEDGWMLIESYKGLKWTKNGFNIERIYFSEKTGLYKAADGKEKVGVINPQSITVKGTGADGWYLIDSYVGEVWLKNGYNDVRLYINNTSGLYNTPSNSEKIGGFGPQFVTAVEQRSDGWIKIKSYKGEKWTKDGVSDIRTYLSASSGIYRSIGSGKVGVLSPQSFTAISYEGDGWYKINSYKGIVYVKNGYNVY